MSEVIELRKKILEMTFEKVEMHFPLLTCFADDNKIVINKETAPFTISKNGAGSMNTHVRNSKKVSDSIKKFYSWSSFTDLQKGGYVRQLIAHMNNAYEKLLECGINKTLYGLIIDDELRGIVTDNFNFLDHNLIIDEIENSKLTITGWAVDEEKMVVHLKVKEHTKNKLGVFIRLVNGHAGRNSLSYRVVTSSNNFFYTIPEKMFEKLNQDNELHVIAQRNRHLSLIQETFSNLVTLVDVASEFNINERLQEVSAKSATIKIRAINPKLTKKQMKIIDQVEMYMNTYKSINTAHDVVSTISKYSSESGYKSAVNGLLKSYLDYFVETM